MVAPNARDVLTRENELLNELAEKAAEYAQSAGIAADVFKGWERGLRRHLQINEELIAANDKDLDAALAEELNLLQSLTKALAGGGDVTQSWKDHFADDIELIKMLQ